MRLSWSLACFWLAGSHSEPYDNYCADPSEVFGHWFTPHSKNEMETMRIELLGLQLILRHGARDLASDKRCFSKMTENFTHCHVKDIVAFKSFLDDDLSKIPKPMVRHVFDAYPSLGEPARTSGCDLGQLLDDVVNQARHVAHEFRNTYFPLLPKSPTSADTRLYSSDKQRALGSLYFFHRFLFEEEGKDMVSDVFTRPVTSDPWALHQYCPRIPNLRHQFKYAHASYVKEKFPDFARRWLEVAGTDFLPSFKDCLLVAKCTQQLALKLPAGLQPDTDLFHEALQISLTCFQDMYLQDPEAVRLMVAPVLVELEHFMVRQSKGEGPLLAVYSTHDSTLIALLAAMGVWDGQWPPYFDTMVLEVYRDLDNASNTFFRFMHRERLLQPPWCTPVANRPGLCSVAQFLETGMQRFRDQDMYERACRQQVPDITMLGSTVTSPLHSSISVLGTLAYSASLVVLGFILGRKLPWKRSWSSSQSEALLRMA